MVKAVFILSLLTLTFLQAQEVVWKRLIVQAQYTKSDSSEFGFHEAGINLGGYDVNSEDWYYLGPPDGQSDYVDPSGFVEIYYDLPTKDLVTGVEDFRTNLVPEDFRIGAFPNPYNPSTNFVFEVPEAGYYDVNLFDILGREIAGWKGDKYLHAGEYTIKLGGGAAGVQFANIRGKDFNETYKLINLGGNSKGFVSEKVNNTGYFANLRKTNSNSNNNDLDKITTEYAITKVKGQWVVPGFDAKNLPVVELWQDNDGDGKAEFIDTLKIYVDLPYPP